MAGRGRCWLGSPWGVERAGLQQGWGCCCHQRHRSVFDVGKGEKCESSPVLPSSPGRRCPCPALLCQQRGRVPHSKKTFFLLARDGWQPGQAAQLVLAPSDTHSSVAQLSVLENVQALPPEHPAGMPRVLPSPWGCKPPSKGFISLIQLVPVPPSKTWLASGTWSSACTKGARHRCSLGCSLPATLLL